jgi:outer membrane protein TolC
MKKTIIIPLILIIVTVNGLAQTNSLSLNDAVKIALANRYDLKIQKVNTEVSNKQAGEVISKGLPQITSDLDVRYNSQLQSNVLPGSVFGTPNASDKEVKFGTTYNTLWGFNISQSVFNPANIEDKKIANLQTQYQQQNEKLTAITIKQEVMEAYFAVLLWQEKVKLSLDNMQRAEEVYETTKNLLSMAQATNYDVQRYEIDVENAKATDEQNKRNYNLAINDLLYKMSTDSIKNPVLTDSINGLMLQYDINHSESTTLNRTELLQQKMQLDIYNENIRKQRQQWLPTLSVYGNYSLQYLNSKYAPFGNDNWYPFNYFGVKASFPIFDGGLKSQTKQEYELRAQSAKLQYSKLESDYKQEINTTQTTLDNSLSDLNYQKKNLALIEDLYKIDSERFKNGTIKQSDLTSTFYTLQQTQTNYINAVYNFLIAKINFQKAIGNL